MAITIDNALSSAISELSTVSDSAHLDALLLLEHVLSKPRSYIYAYPNTPLSNLQISSFKRLLAQRSEGMPIAYLIGKQAFWSLVLSVNKHTLIPRPETEALVEQILSLKLNASASIVDLGTGSGAIALALACERPNWRIIATDYSLDTLKTATKNAAMHKLQTVQFVLSDWLDAFTENEHFDLIVCNPPYVDLHDPAFELKLLNYEPSKALISDNNGLNDLTLIINSAISYLKPQGWLCLEHGYNQSVEVNALLTKKGYTRIHPYQDLNGHNRGVIAQKL